MSDDDQEKFDDAVRELARQDGVEVLLSIPGIWEIVSEYYNNDAMDLVKEDEDEEDETDSDEAPELGAEFFANARLTQPGEDLITETPTEREVEFEIATQPEPKTRPITKPPNTDEDT